MGRKRHLGKSRPNPTDQERKAATLKALSEYQKRQRDPEQLVELLTEESHRGSIILVGTWLEDLLADAIIGCLEFGEEQRNAMLRPGGVLHSFNDKLVMAQAIGVVDANTAEGLDILRSMRNACAHSRRKIDFDTPEFTLPPGSRHSPG